MLEQLPTKEKDGLEYKKHLIKEYLDVVNECENIRKELNDLARDLTKNADIGKVDFSNWTKEYDLLHDSESFVRIEQELLSKRDKMFSLERILPDEIKVAGRFDTKKAEEFLVKK